MFTTLNTTPEASRSPGRKIVSERIEYKNTGFYTSRLLSRKKDNGKYIARFIRECRVPVILPESEITRRFKYRILLNTLIRYASASLTDIAFYDPTGEISCIFPLAAEKFRTVWLVSESDIYDSLNENLLSTVGTCAVRKQKLTDAGGADIIISSKRLAFVSSPYVFGEYGWFVENCEPVFPCGFPDIPEYADIYSAAAGVQEYLGEKEAAKGYCRQLSCGHTKMPAESFFNK